MKHLPNLFKLFEVTRTQPQYGYALSGLRRHELSNLAEHHYLVTMIACQLALAVQSAGAAINVQRVLEFALVHDLGELLGGDISMPYAKANPKARQLAKAFEAENQQYLSQFFGEQSANYLVLSAESSDPQSDEAIIAKVADYIEVTHYKLYMGLFSQADLDLIVPKLQGVIAKLQDEKAKAALTSFVQDWAGQLPGKGVREVITNST